MSISIGRTARASTAAWAGMTGLMFAARRMGLTSMSVTEMEGTFFARPGTMAAKGIGSVMHLSMSLMIGYVYTVGYSTLDWRPNWKTGAIGGLLHWAIAALVVGLVSKVHPRRQQLPMPGFGGLALGAMSTAGFLVGHVVFGMLFGWRYGRDD